VHLKPRPQISPGSKEDETHASRLSVPGKLSSQQKLVHSSNLKQQTWSRRAHLHSTIPPHFNTMDEASAALALRLLRDDVAEALESQKGKQREGQFTDTDLALLAMRTELNQQITTLEDRQMARSISRAAYDDGMAVTIVMQEEARAADDRRLALRLAGRRVPPRPAQARPGRVELDDEALERFSRLSLYGHGESQAHDLWSPLLGNQEGECSKSARSSMILSGQTARTECASCRDSKLSFEVTEMSCKHSYYRECVTRLFEDSITDESRAVAVKPSRCLE
jgi:hypothetical protein